MTNKKECERCHRFVDKSVTGKYPNGRILCLWCGMFAGNKEIEQ